jgi:thymidylate synthase (FAD)
MKLLYGPTVYLIGQPACAGVSLRRALEECDTPAAAFKPQGTDAETLVEFAGRNCYWSFENPRPGGTQAHIENLIRSEHGSVLEHANFTLFFASVPRSLTHEFVRHRAGMAFSELSQRYVDAETLGVCVPPDLRNEVRAADDFLRCQDDDWQASLYTAHEYTADPVVVAGINWLRSQHHARRVYYETRTYLRRRDKDGPGDQGGTRGRKRRRGAARSALPEATETRIVATGNARAWRHIVVKRTQPDAEEAIREAFRVAARRLAAAAPLLFADLAEQPDGSVTTPHPKI